MPALITMERNRLDKMAAWLMTSKRADEEGFYGRFMRPLFKLAAMEVTMPRDQLREKGIYEGVFSSIIGLIHPSDGHPMQEMVPDFCWFRPLSFNNTSWVNAWPDLEI